MLTLLTFQEILHLSNFRFFFKFWISQNCQALNHLEIYICNPSRIFSILQHSRISIFRSRIFTCWTVPELLFCGPFLNFYFVDLSRTLKFWTIPEFLYYESFQNFYFLDHSRILYSGPLQNFYMLDHSRTSTFWTIPEFLRSGTREREKEMLTKVIGHSFRLRVEVWCKLLLN